MEDQQLPPFVRDYKLNTSIRKNGHVIHSFEDGAFPNYSRRTESWAPDKKRIGRGGQGEVFLQRREDDQSQCRAVKRLRLPEGSQRSSLRRRALREIGIIIRFSHEKFSRYFVKSFGWYESKNSLYITMEYLPEGDLGAYLRKHSSGIPEDESRHIIGQILQALVVMHQEKLAHRDIKPGNILIQQFPIENGPSSWWVKVADFGISRVAGPEICHSTVLASGIYTAPEVARGSPSVDYLLADMWSLGATAYEILTGAVVFATQYVAFEYCRHPDGNFPHDNLDSRLISLNGQAIIREMLEPESSYRLSSKNAIAHPWFPPAQGELEARTEYDLSDSSSESWSLDSSPRESLELVGMTTQVSRITGLPTPLDFSQPPAADIQPESSADGGNVASHPTRVARGDATATRAPSLDQVYGTGFSQSHLLEPSLANNSHSELVPSPIATYYPGPIVAFLQSKCPRLEYPGMQPAQHPQGSDAERPCAGVTQAADNSSTAQQPAHRSPVEARATRRPRGPREMPSLPASAPGKLNADGARDLKVPAELGAITSEAREKEPRRRGRLRRRPPFDMRESGLSPSSSSSPAIRGPYSGARSGQSRTSALIDQKRPDSVRDAIRRLILPELNALKAEQRARNSVGEINFEEETRRGTSKLDW